VLRRTDGHHPSAYVAENTTTTRSSSCSRTLVSVAVILLDGRWRVRLAQRDGNRHGNRQDDRQRNANTTGKTTVRVTEAGEQRPMARDYRATQRPDGRTRRRTTALVSQGRAPAALEYRSRQYVVDDWRGHHLSAARLPRCKTGGDYVLAAIATGVILQLLLDN
jgi:Ni/Co efflux regulator RcnB